MGERLTCLLCQGHLKVPDNVQENVLCPCGATYEPVSDYGWFNYSAIVYLLKKEEDDADTTK